MILNEQDLRTLMAAAIAGDNRAYKEALSSMSSWLERFFARRIAPAMVDDLVQETLLAIHSKRATYDTSRPIYPWIAAIARFRWIDTLRKITTRGEVELGDEASIASEEEPVLSRLSLDTLLTHLPAKQQQSITLTKIEGRSIVETAAITGQSESAVKVNIHRGLKKLAALVESE